MRRRDGLLPTGLQIVGHRGFDLDRGLNDFVVVSSDHPGEYAFLINAQIQELYWELIVREMQAAQASLREGNLVEAHEGLLRVVDHHEPLNATWRSLS
jgi:tryptophan 2,3-dioxygenase